MAKTAFILVALCLAAMMAIEAEAAISCNEVTNALYPCYSYVIYGGAPPRECCNAIVTLYNRAASTSRDDRRTACSCLKNVARAANGNTVLIDHAARLPGLCGVSIPYRISPDIDCNTIN